MARPFGRRIALAAIAAGLVGSVAGCSWGSSFPDADVIAGPEGRDVFKPTELTVPVGETVTWGFASSGHNVSCRPDDSDEVRLPKDAEPFASYGRGEAPLGTHVPQGDTYEYTFDVAGEYVYVCIPHVARGMVGRIYVE